MMHYLDMMHLWGKCSSLGRRKRHLPILCMYRIGMLRDRSRMFCRSATGLIRPCWCKAAGLMASGLCTFAKCMSTRYRSELTLSSTKSRIRGEMMYEQSMFSMVRIHMLSALAVAPWTGTKRRVRQDSKQTERRSYVGAHDSK
jgi:hypothetical protein